VAFGLPTREARRPRQPSPCDHLPTPSARDCPTQDCQETFWRSVTKAEARALCLLSVVQGWVSWMDAFSDFEDATSVASQSGGSVLGDDVDGVSHPVPCLRCLRAPGTWGHGGKGACITWSLGPQSSREAVGVSSAWIWGLSQALLKGCDHCLVAGRNLSSASAGLESMLALCTFNPSFPVPYHTRLLLRGKCT
jgi:hypothetical protein